MMRLGRTASQLVAFSLLASATAHAECAWLLWAATEKNPHPVIGDPLHWSPVDGFTVQRDCLETIARSTKDPKNRGWTFRCLPDTVDPRGPKSK